LEDFKEEPNQTYRKQKKKPKNDQLTVWVILTIPIHE
jgi:hypothetical protein